MRYGERIRSGTSVSGWTKRSAGKSTLAVEFLLVGGGGGGGAARHTGGTSYAAGGGGAGTSGGGNNTGGNGGSGVVIVRWLTADATGLSISATGTYTNGTDGSYTWYKWTATGSLVVA